MGLILFIKSIIKKNRGVTYVEIMVAISILAIGMTYIAYDSRYSAKAIYELNEKDNMLYAAQAAIERYKLDISGGTKEENGYSVEISAVNEPIQNLRKVTMIVHPKNTDLGISDIVMVSYVFIPEIKMPTAPSNLTATAYPAGIALDWDQAMYTDSYNIKRSTITGGPYTTIATGVTASSYTDGSAQGGVTYCYVVSASNVDGEGPNSNEVSATIEVDTVILNPSDDTYTAGGKPTTNYGSEPTLYFKTHNQAKFSYKTYLKYDLSSISGKITEAKIKLYGNNADGYSMTVNIHGLDTDSWTETGITWSNAPVEGSVLNTATFTGTKQYVETLVTNYCISELEGDKLASFVVVSSISALGTADSKESLNKPQLVIKYIPQSALQAPKNLKAVPGDTQASLSWDIVSGANSYNIKRGTTTGGPYTTVQTGVATTSYTDIGLTNGTMYYYVVSAVEGAGESSNSNEVEVTPSILTTVTYNPDEDAYIRDGSYAAINYGSSTKLETKNAASGSGEKRISYYKYDLSSLSGEVISTKLRIYGRNADDSVSVGMGFYEIADNTWQESTITFNNAPILGSEIASLTVDDSLKYREVDITDYVKAELAGDKIVNIAAAGKDLVKLLSFNSSEASTDKPELVIVKTLTKPSAPQGLKAVPDDSQISLSWNALPDADTYNVKRSTTDGGPYTTIATGVAAASYVDNPVTNATTYYYVVSAVNAAGESIKSEQVNATPNVTMTVTLNPAADARVESFNPGDNYGTSNVLNVLYDNINNKKTYSKFDLSGYTYNSVVSAKLRIYGNSSVDSFKINAYGVSDNSWTEGGICWGNAPALEVQIGSINVNATVQYYDIDISSYVSNQILTSNIISVGLYTDIISEDNASFSSKEAAVGKPQLVIKMVEGVPKPPTNLTGISGNRLASLSWNASEGAVSYKVKRSAVSGGSYTTVASNITATTYTNAGLKNGSEYYYVVTAVNAKGESINSNEVCVIPGWGATTQTLMPSEDTYIRDGAFADINFGGETIINVSSSAAQNDGNNRHGYISYNLSSIKSVPTSAVLKITGQNITNSKAITVNIYKVTDDVWDEYSLTWNNAPGNDIWIGSALVKKNLTYSIDITDYVKAELAGDKRLSICIKASTDDAIVSFESIEGANPPLLQLVY